MKSTVICSKGSSHRAFNTMALGAARGELEVLASEWRAWDASLLIPNSVRPGHQVQQRRGSSVHSQALQFPAWQSPGRVREYSTPPIQARK